MDDRTPYTEVPLYEPSKEIRLLEVVSPSPNGTLECNLKSYVLFECPLFIALSYEWGASVFDRAIQLAGVEIKVTENLWNALSTIQRLLADAQSSIISRSKGKFDSFLLNRDADVQGLFLHFSKSHHQPRFWIDQLCIDQQNLDERTQQVMLMAHLYAEATLVLVWLGLEGGHSGEVIDFINNGHLRPSKRMQNYMFSLLNRSYWTRLWVVQEVMLARKVVVLCGTRGFMFESLREYLTLEEYREHCMESRSGLLLDSSVSDDFDDDSYENPYRAYLRSKTFGGLFDRTHAAAMVYIHRSVRFPGTQEVLPVGILRILVLCQDQKCTDPRDRIWAVLSFLRPSEILSMPAPNYKLTEEYLFQAVLHAAVRSILPLEAEKRTSERQNPRLTLEGRQRTIIGGFRLLQRLWGMNEESELVRDALRDVMLLESIYNAIFDEFANEHLVRRKQYFEIRELLEHQRPASELNHFPPELVLPATIIYEARVAPNTEYSDSLKDELPKASFNLCTEKSFNAFIWAFVQEGCFPPWDDGQTPLRDAIYLQRWEVHESETLHESFVGLMRTINCLFSVNFHSEYLEIDTSNVLSEGKDVVSRLDMLDRRVGGISGTRTELLLSWRGPIDDSLPNPSAVQRFKSWVWWILQVLLFIFLCINPFWWMLYLYMRRHSNRRRIAAEEYLRQLLDQPPMDPEASPE